ncbi:hypothetical protein DFJ74DRAFT_676123 [Hyaloraphidium curvatum]|nr:hypothetical protein DFJ74DRAFT_676123 [Hyaloraphidium curvatum]
MIIKGKVALVTGGTEGIGLAIVERLLDEGARVIIANRSVANAEKVLPDLRKKRNIGEREVTFVKMDATVMDDVRNAFQAAVDFADGELSIVIANAGFSSDVYARDLKSGNDEGWMRGIQGNLVGTILLGRLSLTYWLEKERNGVFVVTSSVNGMHGFYHGAARGHPSVSYPVVKAAQISYVETTQATIDARARNKGMPHGNQRFHAILPGAVFTNIWGASTPEEVVKQGLARDNWVPMDKLVDAYIDVIVDETKRGTTWVVGGSAGKAVRYPDPPSVDMEKYFVKATI